MNALSESQPSVEKLCINTIRTLAMDAVQKANSGHPGAPMGLAPAAYVLWTMIMKHNPKNPAWYDRDRFVLSGGHASMLLYSLLHLTGYDLSLNDLKNFRQWKSLTPGHPEYGITTGVETTAGPLGQGFANAVGMAVAERHLAALYNRPEHEIVNHYTYVMCGDGDMMEGITSEAASTAGHLGLSRLICLYDDNKITIEGKTDIAFTEDVALRFQAYNWHVVKVEDGNDTAAILEAILKAKAETDRPSFIALSTHIAYGSPNKQDSPDAHGAPLGEEEILLTKKNLGWPETEPFSIPDAALAEYRKCIEEGSTAEAEWQKRFDLYKEAFPDIAKKLSRSFNGKLVEGWDSAVPDFSVQDGPMATRSASGKVLNGLSENVTSLMGGSADLAPSNNTIINSSHDFQKESRDGRNIRFGVREHGMGGILNGMALHKGIIPFGATFFVFSDYLRPSIRLASLMGLPVKYVFTHDSIAVGEDGPTHQPVEHLASLRAIPGLVIIRPADATETAEAWRQALMINHAPVALILSRQKLPVLDQNEYGSAQGLAKGAYILADSEGAPDLLIIATGSEVHIALAAGKELASKGISARVVSMPSQELFKETSKEYQNSILPAEVTARIAVEAGSPMGWESYIGERGKIVGISKFGASAPGGTLMEQYGITAENIIQKAMDLLDR